MSTFKHLFEGEHLPINIHHYPCSLHYCAVSDNLVELSPELLKYHQCCLMLRDSGK